MDHMIRSVSVAADLRVLMNECLRRAGARVFTSTTSAAGSILLRGGGENGPDQCLPIPRPVVELSERPTRVVGEKLSRKSRFTSMKGVNMTPRNSICRTRRLKRFVNAVSLKQYRSVENSERQAS